MQNISTQLKYIQTLMIEVYGWDGEDFERQKLLYYDKRKLDNFV